MSKILEKLPQIFGAEKVDDDFDFSKYTVLDNEKFKTHLSEAEKRGFESGLSDVLKTKGAKTIDELIANERKKALEEAGAKPDERLTAAEKRMQELTEISDALKRDLENERSEKAAFIEGHTQKEIFNKIATEQNFAMPKESAFKLFRTEYKVVEKDGNVEVRDTNGKLVKNSKGLPATTEDVFQKFAKENYGDNWKTGTPAQGAQGRGGKDDDKNQGHKDSFDSWSQKNPGKNMLDYQRDLVRNFKKTSNK